VHFFENRERDYWPGRGSKMWVTIRILGG
jgi:hypothetical protein